MGRCFVAHLSVAEALSAGSPKLMAAGQAQAFELRGSGNIYLPQTFRIAIGGRVFGTNLNLLWLLQIQSNLLKKSLRFKSCIKWYNL